MRVHSDCRRVLAWLGTLAGCLSLQPPAAAADLQQYALLEGGGRFPARQVVFSPDGRKVARLLSAGLGGPQVRIWDLPGLHSVECKPPLAADLHMSPDGRILVVAGTKGSIGGNTAGIRLINTTTAASMEWFANSPGGSGGGGFSADGRYLARLDPALHRDGAHTILDALRTPWNPGSATQIASVLGETMAWNHAAFSPDGQNVVCFSNRDRTLRLYRSATGQEVGRIAVSAAPWPFVFSPDSRSMAWGYGGNSKLRPTKVTVWSIASRSESTTVSISPSEGPGAVDMGLSPDGKSLAVVLDFASPVPSLIPRPDQPAVVQFWDLPSGRRADAFPVNGFMAFGPDLRIIATYESNAGLRLLSRGGEAVLPIANTPPAAAAPARPGGQSAANATGTWAWTAEARNQRRSFSLEARQEGQTLTGVVRGQQEDKVLDGTVRGNHISFRISRQVDGRSFSSSYEGTIEGDTIRGTEESSLNGRQRSREWLATRNSAVAPSGNEANGAPAVQGPGNLPPAVPGGRGNVSGVWTWTVELRDRRRQLSMDVRQEGQSLTGVVRGQQEDKVLDGVVRGNQVSFRINRQANGRSLTVRYEGTIEGDTIRGKGVASGNGGELVQGWLATRSVTMSGGTAGTATIPRAAIAPGTAITPGTATIPSAAVPGRPPRTYGDREALEDEGPARRPRGTAQGSGSATGTWEWTVSAQNKKYLYSLDLYQNGPRLTGRLYTASSAFIIADAKADGSNISFRDYSPNANTRVYEGTVDGDTIRGRLVMTVSGRVSTQPWVAQRTSARPSVGPNQWRRPVPRPR